ncbi:hypothetical protein [Quadrisphaera setariae]|uniref:Uncharacterized protein n=1 Tax=Quadrisphaera setariae TaxID=2593304 RepID=A0A5C8ZET7_9ACTN|nr:hypothetical protein [Quadrisphaera setariae]TXR55713.1 hypothetical protein FMM08_12815 [Quadrisphaera setariae]
MLLRAVVVLLVSGVLASGLLRACAPAPDALPDPVVVRTTTMPGGPQPAAPCASLRVPVGVLAPQPGEGLRLLVVEVAAS